jgi:TolB protein
MLVGYGTNKEETQLLVMNSDGSGVRKLADLSRPFARARWSPSGTVIAFSTAKKDGAGGAVWLINAEGTGLRRLFASSSTDSVSWMPGISWAPHGQALAIGARDRLVVLDIELGAAQVVAEGSGLFQLAWSPNGDYIAYHSDHDGNKEVYVVPADGGQAVNVSQSPWEDVFPRWSPDGEQLMFRSDRDSQDGIYWMRSDGSQQTRIIQTNPQGMREEALETMLSATSVGGCIRPSTPGSSRTCLSPDRTLGATVLATGEPGGWELALFETTGRFERQPVPLTGINPATSPPVWSPDGAQLAFYGVEDEEAWVYTLGVEEGTARRLVPGDALGGSIAWSPDAAYLYFTQGGGCSGGCWPGFLYRVRTDGTGEAEQLTDIRVGALLGFAP